MQRHEKGEREGGKEGRIAIIAVKDRIILYVHVREASTLKLGLLGVFFSAYQIPTFSISVLRQLWALYQVILPSSSLSLPLSLNVSACMDLVTGQKQLSCVWLKQYYPIGCVHIL